jgi:hypothetical protein
MRNLSAGAARCSLRFGSWFSKSMEVTEEWKWMGTTSYFHVRVLLPADTRGRMGNPIFLQAIAPGSHN